MIPPPFQLRPGTSADFDSAAHLLERFFTEEGFATTPAQMTPPLRRLLAGEGGVVLLAHQADVSCGIAVIATALGVEQGGLVAEMTDLYVQPDCRGRGLGHALVLASVDWARQAGCVGVNVVVTREGREHGLPAFYQAEDFTETGRTILYRKL